MSRSKSSNNSFVDRDMLMRYWWGLGIGHKYAHTSTPQPTETTGEPDEGDCQAEGDNDKILAVATEDLELGMDERENEDLGEGFDLYEHEEGFGDEPDDETFLAMEEMYGSQTLA